MNRSGRRSTARWPSTPRRWTTSIRTSVGCWQGGAQRNETLGSEETPGATFGTRASFGRYAHGWATLCNTPFRRHKAERHAGANTTPFIIRWPATLRDAGVLTGQAGHIIDIAPTCLAAAGLSGTGKPPGEGINLIPLCRRGNRAVLDVDWKLVSLHKQDWELYDPRSDPTELENLVAKQPARAQRIERLYRDWTLRCGVLPWSVKRPSKSK